MERLDKLINILKLSPHRQPELVKEASNRILSRSIRSDPQAIHYLKPLIEILIQYCDNDDSAQRSLFNDYLNSVILTFQHQSHQLILQVLINEVTNNGSARTVAAALRRIPHVILNVRPVELTDDPGRLIKALIEVSRRNNDESVLLALDSALQQIMPYMDYHVRKSKEIQLLTNTMVDILLRNLQDESSQIRRIAATSLASICLNSEMIIRNTLVKIEKQMYNLHNSDTQNTNLFVGLCECVKEIDELAKQHHLAIIRMILIQLENFHQDITLVNSALETLRTLFRFQVDPALIRECATLIADKFLIETTQEGSSIKTDVKVVLQANALACVSVMVKHVPEVLEQLDAILLFKNHSDVAIANQLIITIGNYIEASWRFPNCVDRSVGCERIRKLWIELRTVLYDLNSRPDTLKSCVIAIKTCVNTLLESDHCLHIIEHYDFDHLIQLYQRTDFKPFKIEVLNLFACLNYRTLNYLEKSHWSKLRSQTAGSLIDSLQDRVLRGVIISSLSNDHQRIREAASSALISVIPNLYITDTNQARSNVYYRNGDPIVSLAQDLAREHLVALKQADEHINHFGDSDEPVIESDVHDKSCIKNEHKLLSSSIIQAQDNPYNEQSENSTEITKRRHRVIIEINLSHIISLLKHSLENSLEKGKTAISSIVKALHEISLVYPIHQYPTSWDCRASEYCECFTLLNFLLTYLENLNEPDVIVEDLDAYRNFLAFSHQLLYGLCHESILTDYENQRMKPYHKRWANSREGYWSELTIKHQGIADMLDVFYTHLVKLLRLISYIIEEKSNPFSTSTKQTPLTLNKAQSIESFVNHDILISNRLLFGRVYKKLESSFKSSKKNLNQREEKFHRITETCLTNISSLLEFIGMNRAVEDVKDILSYIKITSPTCSTSSLICARQLLKSLFGINILALYQLDPNDCFVEESWPTKPSNLMSHHDSSSMALQGVYHHLVANPYNIFSSYYSMNCSQITPTFDKALAILNYQSRRALQVRRKIEDRVRSLFESNPHQLVSPKVRQCSDALKSLIIEFTPVVTESMNHFNSRNFCEYQSETLHFMSYLILVRVNYQKLPLAENFINSINKLLELSSEKMFSYRDIDMQSFLRHSFTFLTLLTYDRGPSKAMFQVATVIQKLDDLRAKLSMNSPSESDIVKYVVPPLRCLVEDLFMYRTRSFHEPFSRLVETSTNPIGELQTSSSDSTDQNKKDVFEFLEAERETVAQKLSDVLENPVVYDLLSILILESRQNSNEIKYKKFSQHLLSIIPSMLNKRTISLTDYRCIELTQKIIENISPEVFQPVNFIFETLLDGNRPSSNLNFKSSQDFQRWMSLVIISIHILITQVKEEVFLTRLHESLSDEEFVKYLLHIAQLCVSEIIIQLDNSQVSRANQATVVFLSQQLSSYLLYLTHMFQSGLFFQLSRSASDYIRREVREDNKNLTTKPFDIVCNAARDPSTGFSLSYCEKMFYYIKLIQPNLTIFWCNLMMLLNNVDCNREFWRNLLVYECHHCLSSCTFEESNDNLCTDDSVIDESISISNNSQSTKKDETRFKRSNHINRPSSLNLSDISFSDLLRRSFIKKIAAAETRDKALNRNIIETSDEHGQLLEREVSMGNTEQCLSANIELTRRGALCLVLDFVTISMNDVEHITWLIIHHINDIIRWSHELPIAEFINAVHGNSASSGIYIQAVNSGFNNLTSISYVHRLLCTLRQIHYTQYGSLVVLLVEKLLSSRDLIAYRSLTKLIEEFTCSTVQKLLDETNKNYMTTNDEVVNQLTVEDLDRIYSMLDADFYPNLTQLLLKLRESTSELPETPKIELHPSESDSDEEDSEKDVIEVLYSNAELIYWLAEQNYTSHITSLLPALNSIKRHLSDAATLKRVAGDETLTCFLISAIHSLVLTILPPPTRLLRPKFWTVAKDASIESTNSSLGGDRPNFPPKKLVISKRQEIKSNIQKPILSRDKANRSQDEVTEAVRIACLKGLFLLENIEFLQMTQFEYLTELVIRIARLPLINSFVLTPPALWRQNIWPNLSDLADEDYKISFPMIPHHILLKELSFLDSFCDRFVKIGWITRRQFEEGWMTLLGLLSTSLSQSDESPKELSGFGAQDVDTKVNLLASCKVVTSMTKLLNLTRKSSIGDPLSSDSFQVQSFDERVIELTKAIGTNLNSLKKSTQSLLESLDMEKRNSHKRSGQLDDSSSSKLTISADTLSSGFSDYLKDSAQKLRMNAILNVEVDMRDTVVVDNEEESNSRSDQVDVESCVRLLLSIYRQKFKDPNDNILCTPSGSSESHKQQHELGVEMSAMNIYGKDQKQQSSTMTAQSNLKSKPNQLAPPLTTAMCQSMLALSDLFTDYEQFDWLFETFIHLFKVAERNEDELQMQYLIMGLCKCTAVCCYEIPNELTTQAVINHRDVMFEKCRQSIEKCLRSEFVPLKLNALYGVFYLLEDSINIVASGAWELDHFRQLRQSRLLWILKLMPIILEKENSKLLTKRLQIMKLLELTCQVVSESELKAIKS